MTFVCAKMRDNEEIDFSSVVNWSSLKVGPETAITPDERKESTGEEVVDL